MLSQQYTTNQAGFAKQDDTKDAFKSIKKLEKHRTNNASPNTGRSPKVQKVNFNLASGEKKK